MRVPSDCFHALLSANVIEVKLHFLFLNEIVYRLHTLLFISHTLVKKGYVKHIYVLANLINHSHSSDTTRTALITFLKPEPWALQK